MLRFRKKDDVRHRIVRYINGRTAIILPVYAMLVSGSPHSINSNQKAVFSSFFKNPLDNAEHLFYYAHQRNVSPCRKAGKKADEVTPVTSDLQGGS
jgi:hypothetical protein